ncbi:IS701 family transposase [Streptomyces flaveolus]|uniref:IS701 family transposase n=1 Tax=Streptomyces flaveolus TaxID=67297 RepID=UPI003F554451
MGVCDGWSGLFDEFVGRFAGRFGRVEPRRRMRSYLLGLLSEVERKNGWTLAEAVGDAGPQGMQRLLNSYCWDVDGLRDDVRALAVEELEDGNDGVLVVDETGFLKKGRKSAGVARQYSGTAGRIENSQIGVFLAYASRHGRVLVDRELYLPKGWTSDRERCRAAGIPDDVDFATKPALARRMVERALAAGVPFGWVTADAVYGGDGRFRLWLESRDIPHVLAVTKSQAVVSMGLLKERAHHLIARVPDGAWRSLSCGDGVRGPRIYDWVAEPIRPLRRSGWDHWLLARRSRSKPSEIAYYICFAPEGTAFEELIRVAGSRWSVEECFQTAKNETGLDHYQVRGYEAWYRHITLSMTAAAFLVILRRASQKGGPNPVRGRPSSPSR